MSESANNIDTPRSMRHKRILDLAAENPDATFDAIAAEVPSATPDLVERVLEKYGDPAEVADNDSNDTDSDAEDTSTVDATEDEDVPPGATLNQSYPDPDDLTSGQRATLRAILENPEATQRELAEILDISAATVSTRANAIDGFEWGDRAAIAEAVFDDSVNTDTSQSTAGTAQAMTDGAREPTHSETGTEVTNGEATESERTQETAESSVEHTPDSEPECAGATEQVDEHILERLTAIEQQLDALQHTEASGSTLGDPELIQKVLHACMDDNTISEDEELRIIRSLLRSP